MLRIVAASTNSWILRHGHVSRRMTNEQMERDHNLRLRKCSHGEQPTLRKAPQAGAFTQGSGQALFPGTACHRGWHCRGNGIGKNEPVRAGRAFARSW